MLSHAVFTVASLKCMLLVLRFCPSYSGTTPGQPPGNTGGHEPCGQVSTGTPPSSLGSPWGTGPPCLLLLHQSQPGS